MAASWPLWRQQDGTRMHGSDVAKGVSGDLEEKRALLARREREAVGPQPHVGGKRRKDSEEEEQEAGSRAHIPNDKHAEVALSARFMVGKKRVRAVGARRWCIPAYFHSPLMSAPRKQLLHMPMP
eukprot:3172454-Rhodomonas_salina.1